MEASLQNTLDGGRAKLCLIVTFETMCSRFRRQTIFIGCNNLGDEAATRLFILPAHPRAAIVCKMSKYRTLVR
jgi:hypothetical protein